MDQLGVGGRQLRFWWPQSRTKHRDTQSDKHLGVSRDNEAEDLQWSRWLSMTMIPSLPESGLSPFLPCLPSPSLPGCIFQDLLGFLSPGNQSFWGMVLLSPPCWLPLHSQPPQQHNLTAQMPYFRIPAQARGRQDSCLPLSGSPGRQQSWKPTQENRD